MMVFWIRVTKAKVLGSGWLHFTQKTGLARTFWQGWRYKVWGLILYFHSCPRHHFLYDFFKPGLGPLLCISTYHVFWNSLFHHLYFYYTVISPGTNVRVAIVTHCQAYGALSINTVIIMNEGILDYYEFISSVMSEFLYDKRTLFPLLISSIFYIPVYTFYYKYMSLSSMKGVACFKTLYMPGIMMLSFWK